MACTTESAAVADGPTQAERAVERDAWLSPVPDADVTAQRISAPATSRRASNRGFLPMTLDQYLELLDCSAT